MKFISFLPLGYKAIAPGVCLEYITVLLDDHLLVYLKVYPRKSNCVLGLVSWNCFDLSGFNHSPLSSKNLLIAGVINLSNMFLLLVITRKSSAYLIHSVDRLIRRYLPSRCLICIRCSFDFVNGYIASLITFSSPFSVKLAKVGEIIPPSGVPLIGSVYTPASKILAFNHWLTIFFSSVCRNSSFNSHL